MWTYTCVMGEVVCGWYLHISSDLSWSISSQELCREYSALASPTDAAATATATATAWLMSETAAQRCCGRSIDDGIGTSKFCCWFAWLSACANCWYHTPTDFFGIWWADQTSLHYGKCSKPVYSTIRSTHPQWTAGMQSVSETDAAATRVEWGHFEHSM